MRLLHSTTARLAGLMFAAGFIPTVAMLGFMHLVSAQALAADERALIQEMAADLAAQYRTQGRDGLLHEVRDRIARDDRGEFALALVRPDGRTEAGNVDTISSAVPIKGWYEGRLHNLPLNSTPEYRLLSLPLPDQSRLLIGHTLAGTSQIQRANAKGLVLALALSLPLALLLTLILLRLVDRRVSDIARIAGQVSSGDFSQRVSTDSSGDAFDRLGRALNLMLDQIERLIDELRLVTDGLAHDLRSPITRLQTALEQIDSLHGTEALASVEAAQGEARALQGMLSAALQISRAEAGIGREYLLPLLLRPMLDDVAEIYGPLAEETGFTLHVSAPEGLQLTAHRELLGQALGNLIENALHYAEGGHTIALTARETADAIVLEVADDGPGIASQDRGQALKRFGRLDPARHTAGSGLGLSLVRAVARLHGGSLTLDDAHPGLIVRLTLPRQNGNSPA
ncbi:MAG: hypothetical protein RLZZ08_1240 [Pseudomonadota bacterium]|jgi:signal transduction histidine kinase